MAARASKPLLVRVAPGRPTRGASKLRISQTPPGDGMGMKSAPDCSTSHICMSREARLLWVEEEDLEDMDPRFDDDDREELFDLEELGVLDLSLK